MITALTSDYRFDNTAQMHGLMQGNILEDVSIFCRGDNYLNICIDEFIMYNANLTSLCYIPVQWNLVALSHLK